MNESEWNTCTDPQAMLNYLRQKGRASEQKFWLFACACCRLMWHRFSDWRIRRVVEAAELFADGRDAGEHLAAAREAVTVPSKAGVAGFAHLLDENRSGYTAASHCAYGVYCLAVGEPIRPHVIPSIGGAGAEGWEPVRDKLVMLIRDIAGNPFHPTPALAPSVRSWNDGLAVHLAHAAYEERVMPAGTLDPDRLAVLADALEDAGCDNEEILSHLRQQGVSHYRGCWALDLLLAKT